MCFYDQNFGQTILGRPPKILGRPPQQFRAEVLGRPPKHFGQNFGQPRPDFGADTLGDTLARTLGRPPHNFGQTPQNFGQTPQNFGQTHPLPRLPPQHECGCPNVLLKRACPNGRAQSFAQNSLPTVSPKRAVPKFGPTCLPKVLPKMLAQSSA